MDTDRWLKKVEKNDITPIDFNQVIQLSYNGLDRYAVAQQTGLKLENVDAIRARIVVLEYIRGKSLDVLEDIFHIRDYVIKEMLEEFRVQQPGPIKIITLLKRLNQENGEYINYKEISPVLEEILVGNLLGDGFLGLTKRIESIKNYIFPENPTFEQYQSALRFFKQMREKHIINLPMDTEINKLVSQYNDSSQVIIQYPTSFFALNKSILELRYIEFGISKKLHENNYPHNLGVYFGKHVNDGLYHLIVRLATNSTIQLASRYKNWYPTGGEKIVPKDDFQLTANTLFIWYVDDGSYSKDKRRFDDVSKTYTVGALEFSTAGFTEEEVDFLVSKLNKHLNIDAFKFKRDKYWLIRIGKNENIKKFIDYLLKNADSELVNIAVREFPYKFYAGITQESYHEQCKVNNDPLVEMHEIALPKEKLHDHSILDHINALLKKAGSNLTIHEPNSKSEFS